ncbi:CPBP family intramembrane glutamic endopeptidase [Dactylosporangium matsuzakiense]|uniref:CPBP family intramembrane glutamic endopeptidase n=1 Tax=Dactylosporangium matsuzakiense TaxID=53360 RepID=UPI0022F2D631|nr:CPBP family intramembrane glutamic endopeptidase [Dactylosporangium matsuzakiense]
MFAVAVFAGTAPLLHRAGYPPVWGMILAVLFVVVPVEVVLLRRSGHRPDLALPSRADVLRRLLPTLVAALLAPGMLAWLEPALQHLFGRVLPVWWRLDPVPAQAPAWHTILTVVGWLLAFVVVGPIVEEAYFRGVLLPAIPARPAVAVLTNAALFTVYHLWQPATWLTVFVFTLPLTIVARRPGGVVVAMIVHCGVNAVTYAALLAGLAHR